MNLTKEEINAINTLKRLEKRWPDSLWLMVDDSGNLHVMRKIDFDRVMENDGRVNMEQCLEVIRIESDGCET